MSSRKGDRAERELVNALDAAGFAVMRAPASGSATDRELPDVLAGNVTNAYAIEVKSSSSRPIYLAVQEVADLRYFAESFGSTPVIGVKFNVKNGDHAYGVDGDPGFRFFKPTDLRTERNAYRVKREKWAGSDVDIDALWEGI